MVPNIEWGIKIICNPRNASMLRRFQPSWRQAVLGRMMPFCNTGMSRRTLVVGLLVGLLCAAAAMPGRAQLIGEPALEAPLVEPSDGEVAFGLVEGWVRAGEIPEDEALPGTPLTGLFGVYVTLRDRGQLLGKGQALREDLAMTIDAQGPPTDMAVLLARATREAMAAVEQHQRRQAQALDIVDADPIARARQSLLSRLQVDVQIGYGLSSVVLPANGAADEIYAHFVPGFHGLRMTGALMPQGDLIWPGVALARNTSPRSQLVQLLKQQGYNDSDIETIARSDGPRLERFEVIHIVRPVRIQSPRILVRGNDEFGRQFMDTQTLEAMIQRIAAHLGTKITDDNGAGIRLMRGPYLPSYNRIEPAAAPPHDAALACFVQMRYCTAELERSASDREARTRVAQIKAVIKGLAITVADEQGHLDPLIASMLLMALSESPIMLDADLAGLRDQLGAALLSLRQPEGHYRATTGSKQAASRATASVITAALARWYARNNDPQLATVVWQAMGELIQANQADEQGASLVDLTWLAMAYSYAGRQAAGAQADPVAAELLTEYQAFFADQVDRLIDRQIRGRVLLGPRDVVGGFETRDRPLGSAPAPTWESAMPLLVLSIMLRDPDVIPMDRNHGPVLCAGLGARFIGQLMMTDRNGYYVRNMPMAFGGIRRSLWDNELHLNCSSIALLALTEMKLSLEGLEAQDAPQ